MAVDLPRVDERVIQPYRAPTCQGMPIGCGKRRSGMGQEHTMGFRSLRAAGAERTRGNNVAGESSKTDGDQRRQSRLRRSAPQCRQ